MLTSKVVKHRLWILIENHSYHGAIRGIYIKVEYLKDEGKITFVLAHGITWHVKRI